MSSVYLSYHGFVENAAPGETQPNRRRPVPRRRAMSEFTTKGRMSFTYDRNGAVFHFRIDDLVNLISADDKAKLAVLCAFDDALVVASAKAVCGWDITRTGLDDEHSYDLFF